MLVPMDATAIPASTVAGLSPAQARRDLMWRDHGGLRQLYRNFHWISPAMARANQPSPDQLAKYAALGIVNIINLRGPSERGHYVLEREACRTLGLTLLDLPCSATQPPPKALIHAARNLFGLLDGKSLLHCKSGSDRTGFMGALYRHFVQGDSIESALEQLSPRYLHLRHGKAGVMDFFFETYLTETAASNKPFIDWVIEDYDPDALARNYKARAWALGLVELILPSRSDRRRFVH